MIRLSEITEENWLEAAALSVKEHQKAYLAPAIGILARGYVYRNCRGHVYAIENDGVAVGLALVREFTDEPLGYDLQQFMIDRRYQGKGYGAEALSLILDTLRKEGHYDHVEVCVKKENAAALRLFERHGFVDSGYVDETAPDMRNLICRFSPSEIRDEEKGAAMEEQIVSITIRTKGEPCGLSDEEIKKWYADRIGSMFDPRWGTPEITVALERKQLS